MPDVFVPADTTDVTKYFVEVAGRNILYRYTIEYADRHREALNKVRTIPELQALLDSDKGLVEDFIRYAARKLSLIHIWAGRWSTAAGVSCPTSSCRPIRPT